MNSKLIDDLKNVKLFLIENNYITNIIPEKIENINSYFDNIDYKIDDINEVYTDILNNILSRKSKLLRPYILYKIADFYKMDLKRVASIFGLIEILHNSSLIIDDIEDESEFRRNLPCVHKIYGVDLSINAGCLGYFVINKVIEKWENVTDEQKIKIYNIYFEGLKSMHIGQGLDIYYHKLSTINNRKFLNKKLYKQIVYEKTSRLILIGIQILDVIYPINNIENLMKFCKKLMYVFQVKDDIKNLIISDVSNNKNILGEDILEGKQTLIFLKFIELANEVDLNKFWEIFKKDKTRINEAIQLFKKYESIKKVEDNLKNIIKKLNKLIEEIFNDETLILFKELLNFILI